MKEQIERLADELIELLRRDNESHSYEVSPQEARDICRRILEAAAVDDLGGCPLCQS